MTDSGQTTWFLNQAAFIKGAVIDAPGLVHRAPMPCKNCNRGNDRPSIFIGEPFCSIKCAKALGLKD